jgi:putative transposase
VLVDRNHPKLSIRWQCALLSVARSGLYRARPAANDDDVLTTMRRIDELFTAWPLVGLAADGSDAAGEGISVKRKRRRRLGEGTRRQPQAGAANHKTCAGA